MKKKMSNPKTRKVEFPVYVEWFAEVGPLLMELPIPNFEKLAPASKSEPEKETPCT